MVLWGQPFWNMFTIHLATEPLGSDAHVAILASPGSVAELAAAIKFLVERPSWRNSLGRRARSLALAKYTWDREIEHILDRLGGIGEG